MKTKAFASTLLLSILLFGCGGSSSTSEEEYPLHKDITVTIFWTGEDATSENGYIANIASAWDDLWMLDYGGLDDPYNRDGYIPASFIPLENSFYFALPYNDFDENGEKKKNLTSYIPWAKDDDNTSLSICKNRWIEIIKNDKKAYAQWEDVGPFGEDDVDYVFGDAKPANSINDNAGLDVSPAVRDYLGLNDIDKISWRFVDEKDVPSGPWKNIVTTLNVNWPPPWYKPDINTTWEWQLTGELNTSYDADMYDIDLFDTNQTTIAELKHSGKKVICYFSAGTYEDWREDKDKFPSSILGNDLEDWEGEKWIDIRKLDTVLPIMRARLDLAKEKGCDGVEPDNVDGYSNDTGFDLTYQDQLIYNKTIANEARKRGLSVGLKNDLDQVEDLVIFYDFALNEECHIYNECDKLQPFIDANKPVFNAEYDQKYIDDSNEFENLCKDAKSRGFQTIVLPKNLDGTFRLSCE